MGAQSLYDKRKEDEEKTRRNEMEKPMNRDKNDIEMNDYVKSIQRIGDPMEQYLAEKKKKADKKKGKFPEYKGPLPPPNRFGIKPGYRWDGVDRSTGFESRYFYMLANVKSLKEF